MNVIEKNAISMSLVLVALMVAAAGLGLHHKKLHEKNASLMQSIEMQDRIIEAQVAEWKRMEKCAVRQIKSLIKICEDSNIPLAQNIETSEWVEGLKPLTPVEFEEFREAWTRRLETGISPMSGRPIELDDHPTVALIAGLKAARLIRETIGNRQSFPAPLLDVMTPEEAAAERATIPNRLPESRADP